MAILLNLGTFVIGEQEQVLTFCLPCGQQQTANLTLAGPFCRNVVGDLDALLHFVALTNYEITFSGAVVQIINVPPFHLAFPDQMHGYDGLQAVSQVLARKSILPLVHHGNIDGIDFLLDGALLALLGVFLHADEHVGLFEIIDIVLGRMLRFEMEESCQVGGDNDGRRHIQQMVRQLLEGGFVDNLEAFLDVPFQDILYQRIDISLVVFDDQQFREAALFHVVVKGGPAEAFGLGGAAVGVHLLHYAILLEREGVKGNLFVASGQEGCQLAAEELGIGAGDDDVHLLAKQAVHEQMPAFYILYLVEQKIIEIAVDLVENFQDVVELVGLEIYQTLIVEIGIGIFDAHTLQRLIAEGGLAASPDADDCLRLGASQIYLLLFRPAAEGFFSSGFHFFLLVGEDKFQGSLIDHGVVFLDVKLRQILVKRDILQKEASQNALFCRKPILQSGIMCHIVPGFIKWLTTPCHSELKPLSL